MKEKDKLDGQLEKTKNGKKRKNVSLYFIIHFLLCGAILIYAWHGQGQLEEFHSKQNKIINDLSLAKYYSQSMEQALDMAVNIKESNWQNRYKQYQLLLKDKLGSLLSVANGFPELYEKIGNANAAFLQLNRDSDIIFENINNGNRQTAQEELNNPLHKKHENDYNKSLTGFTSQLIKINEQAKHRAHLENLFYKLIITFSILFLNVWVIYSIRKMRGASEKQRQLNEKLKAVNSEMFKNREYLKGVVENISIGISILSPKMEILSLNKKMRQWFPDIDITDKPKCYMCFNDPPRLGECSYCPVVKTLEDGKIHEAVTKTPANGEIRNYRIVSTPIFDEDGKIVSVIEMTDDITDQKQYELKLIEARLEAENSRERFQSVVNCSQDWIWEVDEKGCYTYVSDGVESFLQYKPSEIIGKSPFDLMPKDEKEKVSKIFEECVRQHKPISDVENWNLTKQGKMVCLLTNAVPIFEQGKFKGYCGVDKDITAWKKVQRDLENSRKKAESANKSKSEFLANMSHEIRTPMNAIIGFSDLMMEEKLTRTQVEYAEIIRSSAHNLLGLINDILDFSKIEAGKLDIEIAECEIGSLLSTLESMFKAKATEKGIDFQVLQCSDLPAVIHTDPVRVNQCLINLISNAMKFTEQGHVYLNVALEEIDNKTFVRFDVEDTGIGISQEKQQRIFDAFSQADSSTTRKYGGTGLGLSITKKLSEMLGGNVRIHSSEGKGSLFTLLIPTTKQDAENVKKYDKYEYANGHDRVETEQQQRKLDGRVLVAEDTKSNQMLIKILLAKIGMQVEIVEDGKAAVDRVGAENFDVVLMDINMAGMDGFEAIKKIREQGNNIPVIALTANALKGFREKCLNSGFDDYVRKPIDKNELLSAIEKQIEGAAKS